MGLLRHIGMEEKILFPALREAAGYAVVADLEQLRAAHSRIVALLEVALARLHAARVPPVRPFFDGQLPARAGTPKPSK